MPALLSGGAPGDATRTRPALPHILCYHKVERRLELGVTRLSPRRFARQMERFARDGWRCLTFDELAAAARGERPAGEKELAITFDDAYRGLREHAFPVLEALGFGATCFVITEYAGRLNEWDVAYGGRRFAHLAWRDIRKWEGRGITFASHTATHPRLTWLPDAGVRREMARSRAAMTAALGAAPRAISYPFGAFGAREVAIARGEGYDTGFALAGRWRGDAMAVTRLPVYPWSLPRPGVGLLAAVERAGASGANRCAVGTSLWKKWREAREPDAVIAAAPVAGD
ncbi:MAG TPA: polysaccharide deacetylase family protein [Gemmatimonadaceae bacterium]|nr:polysaccharide deacetylase family protein [Gemmatimonadaceae bacterium]